MHAKTSRLTNHVVHLGMLSLGLKVALIVRECQVVVEFARLRILSTNKVALDERQLLRVGRIRAVHVAHLVHSFFFESGCNG